MDTKKETSRLTLDLPKNVHMELKALALLTGKTMRELFIEAIPYIKETGECLLSEHIPNKKTIQSIQNIETGEKVEKINNIQELFKKAGIKC